MRLRGLRLRAMNALCTSLRRKVILFNGSFVGVGNRLKGIASFHRLHGLGNTHIYWCLDEWVNESLTSVFDLESLGPFFEHRIKPTALLPAFYSFPEIPHVEQRGAWRLAVDDDLPSGMNYTPHGATYPIIDFGFHSIPPAYVQAYLGFFNNVRPSRQVRERIGEVRVDREDICVHIRIPVNPKDRANASPLKIFVDVMRAEDSHRRFFVSAHSPDVVAALKGIFPGRILELPNKRYDRLTDAAADLFLLSQGGRLIASSGSTFSEVAWWLGGAQQQVRCV